LWSDITTSNAVEQQFGGKQRIEDTSVIVRRAAAALAVAGTAIMLFGSGGASAGPMNHWSVDSGTVAPAEVLSADRPMLPWGGQEHGPVAPDGVTIDSAHAK
jgi:hypothetical protein